VNHPIDLRAQDVGASADADRAATATQPSPAVSGKAGIPCAFTPKPDRRSNPSVSHLRLEFTPEKASQLRAAADAYGLSLRSFCIQAIDYALANLAARGAA
jgi:glutamine synthetase